MVEDFQKSLMVDSASMPQWDEFPRRFESYFKQLRANILTNIRTSLDETALLEENEDQVEIVENENATSGELSAEEMARKEYYMDGYMQGFADGASASTAGQNGPQYEEVCSENIWNVGMRNLQLGDDFFNAKESNVTEVGLLQPKPPKIRRIELPGSIQFFAESISISPDIIKSETELHLYGHSIKYTTNASYCVENKTNLIFSPSPSPKTERFNIHSIINEFGRNYHVIRLDDTIVTIQPRRGVEWEQFKVGINHNGQLEIKIPE